MSEAMNHRLQVLEQKLLVMQKEVSEVIGEMQQALTGLMRAQAMASAVANSRLTELEQLLPPRPELREEDAGKEL